jgi:carbon storage regulator CsrA
MEIIELNIGSASRLGSKILLRVLAVRGKSVQLGFEAPGEVHIWRSELNLSPKKNEARHDTCHSHSDPMKPDAL